MDEITKDTLIPNELVVKILDEIVGLAEKHGLSREAIKNGTLKALRKWEEKNADKSGG